MGLLFALISSAMWGTADFLGGTMSRRLPVVAVVLGSQCCAFVVMLVVATVSGSWGSPRDYVVAGVGAGLTGLIGLSLFYAALATGTMGIVSPIAALGVLVPLAFGLVLGQLPTAGQYIGIALALLGIILASGPEISGASGVRPVLLALGAALGFGLSETFIAQGSVTSVTMTMLTMRTVSVLVAIGAIVVTRSIGGVRAADLRMLAVIGLFDVLANVAFGLATQKSLLPLVAVLGNLYPVMTVLLAWRILHERLARMQYVGIAVALLGVVAISALGTT